MNEAQRKQLEKVVDTLIAISTDLESMSDDEQKKFDNMSQGMQEGDKGQAIDEAINCLNTTRDYVDSAICELEQIV